MGAAVELQAEGELEGAASCRRGRSDSTEVPGGSRKSQASCSPLNSRFEKDECHCGFFGSFLLCGSHGGLDLAGGFVEV